MPTAYRFTPSLVDRSVPRTGAEARGALPLPTSHMSKKWLDWSTGACREPGQGTAGHCDCARGTLSKKDGRPSRPARAANRGGGQRSVAVAHFTPCPKRRLDWSICARREPGREDSEALRLLTPHHVPKNGWAGRPARAANRGGGQRGVAVAPLPAVQTSGQGGYWRTKTEAQMEGYTSSALLWLCSPKKYPGITTLYSLAGIL